MKTKSMLLLVAVMFVFACVLTSCNIFPTQHEHKWENATCTAPKTCSECGETEGEALGHAEESLEASEATCTETGLTEGKKCSVCGEILVAQEVIPANGHSYDNACDADCNVCDEERTPADHVYDNACDADCNECGEPREVGDHVYDNACDADCNECGETRDVGDHGYDNACDVDCNECGAIREVGEHVYDNACDAICNECNYERTVAGHNIVKDEAVAPTCETTGLKEGEHCTICGYKVEQEVISALGHKYEVSYVWSEDNSTCTATGVCKNDAAHTVNETATVSVVVLSVSRDKVTYTYKVDFENAYLDAQEKSVDGAVEIVGNIVTVNAPAIANRVASHDYVKFDLHNAEAAQEFSIYYSECDVWDGTSVSTGLEGEGTEEKPYLIQSGADLAYIAQRINALSAQSADFVGKYFLMTKSIDLNGNVLHIGTGNGWNTRQSFSGYIDGNNCTIRGINNTLSLFANVYNGWIKNLSVYGKVNTSVNTTGALVGYLLNSTLHNVTNYADIIGVNAVGGLVGVMEQKGKTSDNVVNYGSVTGTSWQTGGIAGKLGGNIKDSVNWGTVIATKGSESVGGIAGSSQDKDGWEGTITNCISYGAINNNGVVAGHIIGVANRIVLVDCPEWHLLVNVPAVGASCGVAGNVEYDHCTVCLKNFDAEGKVLESVETEALKHNYEETVVPPTCTEAGYTNHKCSICGDEYKDSEVAASHKDENSDYKCDSCGESLCNHNPGEPVKEKEVAETCTTDGSYDTVVYCSICEEELSRETTVIKALGHACSYEWSEDNSTCTVICANDAAHTETAIVSSINLSVSATKVTYMYNVAFVNSEFAAQTKSVDAVVELTASIATINAPAIANRVASHDYVKLGFHNAEATYTFTIYYSEVDVWDGTSVSESLSGEGTEESPYLIQSAADLAYIAKVVNEAAANTANFKGQYFKMTKSIDLNGKELKIGLYSASKAFHGYFDGNNCSIRGINNTQSLFGMLKDGYIKNLSTYGKVTTTEKKGVAGLVSYMSGATVENITNYVDVTGVQQVAGVVGWLENNTTTVAKNCVNYGTIKATSYQIGGIAGFAKGTISGCTNFGDVTSTAGGYVGGIGGSANDAKGSRSDCVNYGNISGTDYVGGCFGTINKTTTDFYSYGTAKTVTTGKNIGEVVGGGASYLKYTEE